MTWLAALALLRRVWPALPIAALALWAGRLDHLRAGYAADLAACQSGRQIDRANADRDAARAEAGWAKQEADAARSDATRTDARQPIIVRSTDTVRTYAQTPAGRAACLGADRAAGVQRDRDALAASFDPGTARPASASAPGVPTDPASAGTGRVNVQR